MDIRALELIWLMVPAYTANMAPPFVRFWRGWNRPLHRRLLGAHKTVMGFGLGVTVAVAAAWLQSRAADAVPLLLWDAHAWLTVGLASGVGALGGDAVKSYFKRRRGIAPGHRWIPADQIDFVIGSLVALAFVVRLGVLDVALVLAFSFVADIAVNHAAYRLRIRDSAW